MRLIDQIEEKYYYQPTTAIVNLKVRGLCRYPYDRHPYGCPNFGMRPDCPPNVPVFTRIYKDNVEVVAVAFNLAQFIELRKEQHPEWTDKALINPRHWQEHVRMHLRNYLSTVNINGLVPVLNPEAMGVDVTTTCENADIHLEWPPQHWVHKVALLAMKIDKLNSFLPTA